MTLHNKMTDLINQHSDKTECIDSYFKSLYKWGMERNPRDDIYFNGNVLSSDGILKIVDEVKGVFNEENFKLEYHRENFPKDFKIQKYIKNREDFFNDYLTIKNGNFQTTNTLYYLPERTFKYTEYIKYVEDKKIAIEKFNDLLIINIGQEDFYNSKYSLSILIDSKDQIREIRIKDNQEEKERRLNEGVFLNLVNDYGLLNLDNTDLNDLFEISHDINFNLNNSDNYKILKTVLLDLYPSNELELNKKENKLPKI